MAAKIIEHSVRKKFVIIALVATYSSKEQLVDIPPYVAPILKEFAQVFSKELLNQLPPMRDIQHVIDLIL